MSNVSSSNSHKGSRPALQFRGFSDEWFRCSLSDIAEINPTSNKLPNDFYYIDLESVVKGNLIKDIKMCKANAPSRAQRLVAINDILFQTVRPYQQNNFIFEDMRDLPTVASTGYAQIRTNENSYYLYTLLHTKHFLDEVLIRCTGSSYPAISSNDLGEISIIIPTKKEQERIAAFMRLLDCRINVQHKLLLFLKSYKRGVLSHFFAISSNTCEIVKLGKICAITTGKLDANASDENGQYPFFTCSKTTLKINSYAFDAEAILIAGNGDIGHTKYYSGKFNAYQRTYVLTDFTTNAHYIQAAIDTFLPKRIAEETQGGAMPYIKLSTLSELSLPILPKIQQEQVCSVLNCIDKQIESAEQILIYLCEYKSGLLQQLFI